MRANKNTIIANNGSVQNLDIPDDLKAKIQNSMGNSYETFT